MLATLKKNAQHLVTRNCGGYWSDGKIQSSVAFPRYRRGNVVDKNCARHDHCMHYARTSFDRLQCDVAYEYDNAGQSAVGDFYVYLVKNLNPYFSQYEPTRESIPLSDRSDYPKDYSGPYIPNMPFYDPIPFEIGPSLRGTLDKSSDHSGDPGGRTISPVLVYDPTITNLAKRHGPTRREETPAENPDYSKAVVIYTAKTKTKNQGPPQGDMRHVQSLTALLNNNNARKRIKKKKKNAEKKNAKSKIAASVKNDNGSGVNRKQHSGNQKLRAKS